MPMDKDVKNKILDLATKYRSDFSEDKIADLTGRIIYTINDVNRRNVKLPWEQSLVKQAENLTEYIKNKKVPLEMRIRCFAALRYFEEKLDAIKDTDRMVGYLDDAVVVQDIHNDIVNYLKNPGLG